MPTNTSAEKAAPPAPRLVEAIRANRPIQIGVFGDSFSDGVWWALDQEFSGDVAKAHKFGRPATGFVDYTKIDLLDDARKKMDARPIDVAVIIFGGNDTQPLHGAERPTPFLSDGWKQVVGGRVDAMVSLLEERGVTIIWVGLPKMRAANYDERVTRLNAYYAEEMRKHGIPYLETVSITSDASGAYSETLKGSDGQSRPARNRDGIHMSMSGYRVLAAPLVARLRTMIDEARRAVAQPG